jgi:hypothetical protein
MLVRHGIRDPGAVEDTMSLVFDHLRRLSRRERLVCACCSTAAGRARNTAGASSEGAGCFPGHPM